jgi:hypothetical protein
MKTHEHLQKYLAEFFWEWETFETKGVETIKKYYMFNNIFPEVV